MRACSSKKSIDAKKFSVDNDFLYLMDLLIVLKIKVVV